MPKFGTFPGDIQEGDVVGGTCTVLDYIGRGAMAHVYRVRHNSLNAEYALKMMNSDQFNEEAARLFKRESYAIYDFCFCGHATDDDQRLEISRRE